MIKVLLKKQVAESLSAFTVNRKNGYKRSKTTLAVYLILFAYLIAVFCKMFYSLACSFFSSPAFFGNEWLGFALMAMISVAFGVFVGAFSAYSTIYEPKDNDLLLSMPIKPQCILAARLLNCYAAAFFIQALVLVPTALAYVADNALTVGFALLFAVALLFLPLLTLTLSCALGYLLALAMAHVTNKSFVTTLLSLVFLAAYYYIYFQAQKYINYVFDNSAAVGATVKTAFFPFYCMGRAVLGDFKNLLLFLAISVLPFSGIYALLSASFIKLATAKRGKRKKQYVAGNVKSASPFAALFRKEVSHFLHSSVYLLNTGMPSLLMIVAAAFAVIKSDDLTLLCRELSVAFGDSALTLIFCGILGGLVSLGTITAPSVSLEGNYIYVLKSMPVSGFTVAASKVALHLLFTSVPSFLLSVVILVISKLDAPHSFLLIVFSQAFPLFTACLGLILNFKLPNFTWTNESVAVKQSASVVISMFAPIALLIGGVLLYSFAPTFLTPSVLLVCAVGFFTVAAVCLFVLLKIKSDKWLRAL